MRTKFLIKGKVLFCLDGIHLFRAKDLVKHNDEWYVAESCFFNADNNYYEVQLRPAVVQKNEE